MAGRLRVRALIVVAVVLASTALPVTGSLSTGGAAAGPADGSLSPAPDAPATLQVNNSTRHHDDPRDVSGEGDLVDVRGWLSGRLLERLSGSAVQLDRREYERAKALLGDDYDSRLTQLVDVVGETDTDSDDGHGEPFRAVQRTQRDFSDAAAGYEEAYESYQRAVENGNETAARERARRLQRLENRTSRLNRTLVDDYRTLENQTGADLSEATASIANVSENISERQQEIDRALFTATQLRVSPDAATISYSDPLVARGQLLTDSGAAVANRTITVRVHTRTRTVETDADGEFRVRYRPRTIPVNRSSLAVEYVPDNESEFLASDADVAVDIEQETASLSVEGAPANVAYGDRLSLAAALELDGRPVTGVPVRAAVGSTRLAGRATDGTGTAALDGTFPAAVPGGQRQLTLSAGAPNAAVRATPWNRSLTVQPTSTSLSVGGNRTAEARLTVAGRLTTADGQPVGGQSVRISTGGAVVETASTRADGSYSVTVDGADLDASDNGTVRVRARFDGQGTNLNASAATARIDYRASASPGDGGPAGPGSSGPFSGSATVPVVAVVVTGAVLLALFLGLRRRDAGADAADAATDGPAADESTTESADRVGVDFAPGEAFLRDGRTRAAVQYTYQHLRQHVADGAGVAASDTHWEFFNKCRDAGMDERRVATLRELVETYESVQFYDGEVDVDVQALIDSVRAQWAGDG